MLDGILAGLRAAGRNASQLTPADLAPVDAFHIRGRESTIELAGRTTWTPGLRVLDVGCGLGGSARYLASEHGARVTGIDLTTAFVVTAKALAELVGLHAAVSFQQASALDLPFPDASFDVIWTEHAQMNVEDKRAFYASLARVLVPGGRLLFHDIFQGPGGPPHFPEPWAESPAISFLEPPNAIRAVLADVGFTAEDWEDRSDVSLAWFRATFERIAREGPPPLGLHLVMGPSGRSKLDNLVRSLAEQRVTVVQAALVKSVASGGR